MKKHRFLIKFPVRVKVVMQLLRAPQLICSVSVQKDHWMDKKGCVHKGSHQMSTQSSTLSPTVAISRCQGQNTSSEVYMVFLPLVRSVASRIPFNE